jgi:hypothetical protein
MNARQLVPVGIALVVAVACDRPRSGPPTTTQAGPQPPAADAGAATPPVGDPGESAWLEVKLQQQDRGVALGPMRVLSVGRGGDVTFAMGDQAPRTTRVGPEALGRLSELLADPGTLAPPPAEHVGEGTWVRIEVVAPEGTRELEFVGPAPPGAVPLLQELARLRESAVSAGAPPDSVPP